MRQSYVWMVRILKRFFIRLLLPVLTISLFFAFTALPCFGLDLPDDVLVVDSESDLIEALGGEENVKQKNGMLYLMQDVTLTAPIVITEGSYTLIGAGVVVTADFTVRPWITLSGEDVTLVLGQADVATDNDNLVFDGAGIPSASPTVVVGQGCTLSFYRGTRFKNIVSQSDGAAIINDGTTYMYGGVIENCSSLNAGGAIANQGELFLAAGEIFSCSAVRGGAIVNYPIVPSGDDTDGGVLHLIGTEIRDCTAAYGGGAVYNGGTVNLLSSTISSCQAEHGGAMYNVGKLTLSGGQILTSEATCGGALFNAGTLTLDGTYFEENTAASGGNLYNSGKVAAKSGTLSDGYAKCGGNVYNAADGSFELIGATIVWGEADVAGGIYNEGSLTVRGGSVTLNEAEVANGILNLGTLIFTEDAYVNKSNEIWILVTEDQSHLLRLEGKVNSTIPGTLRPCLSDGETFLPTYPVGELLVNTEKASSSAEYFVIAAEEGEYLLTSDGILKLYQRPDPTLLYLILVFIAFVLTVLALVIVIRCIDRRKGRLIYEKRS